LQLGQLLRDFRAYNCFNPSLIFFGELVIIAFRAFNATKTKPFHAYLLFFNKINYDVKVVNLSEQYCLHGIDNVADPKLTVLSDQVWITFNTGYSKKENNLFLAQVYPELNTPYLCKFAGRARVEKNWAFFIENGVLKAIYSICPVSILVEKRKDEINKTINFDSDYIEAIYPTQQEWKYLTIGTPAICKNNQLYLMAHERKYFLGRRLYMGVPVRIKKVNHQYIRIDSKKRFVHSYWSLLGSLKKHNKNLWSCTYFSGLQIKEDDKVILGYGINDQKYSFKEVSVDKLW
jgi:hypothetical protein